MIRHRHVLAFALFSGIGLFLAACGGEEPEQSTAPATTPSATGSTTSEFGVPECDDYVKKIMACMDKMPEAARTSARTAFDQSRNQWKAAAATAEGRSALSMTCKAATDSARTATSAYGCEW
jgi:hypothetical protein